MKHLCFLALILLLSVSFSGCLTKNVIYQSTYSSYTESSEESASALTNNNFLEEYYNQLFAQPYYSIEEVRAILKSAINKDLWYYGEYSKFHKLIGKEYLYLCNRATSKSIGYLLNIEPALDPSKINNYTANFYFVSLDPAYYQTEVTLYECKELIIKNKDELFDFINNNNFGVIPFDRDYIKIETPAKPKYKSSKFKEQELADIKSDLKEALQKANIKGKHKIYVKNFLDEFYPTDELSMVKTDVFIVDENDNIYLAVYDKNTYQSISDTSEVNWFIDELKKISPEDKQSMYYFNKIKETAAQTYTLEIK